MAEVTLQRHGQLVMVVGHAPDLGIIDASRAPKTTTQMRRANPGILAAVDGPMFNYGANQPHDYARYAAGTNRFRLKYPTRGISIDGNTPTDGSTLYVQGGRPFARAGATIPNDATFAVQLFPTLVREGSVIQGLSDRDNNKRAAVGILNTGDVFLAVHPSISMPAFAEALRAAGATFAGYTDGGGSAALFVDEDLNGSPEYSYNNDGRRVISWVTLERKTLPQQAATAILTGFRKVAQVFQPNGDTGTTTADGAKVAVVALLVLGIGGGLIYAMSEA